MFYIRNEQNIFYTSGTTTAVSGTCQHTTTISKQSNHHPHLIVSPLERVDVAGAPTRLRLVDVAAGVAVVVTLHELVGRPLVCGEELQGEGQEPSGELLVVLEEVVHVHLRTVD